MSKSLDRISLLATYIRIADSGSISAAARDLGLSQPSVSRQLVDLEKRLNTQLIRRNTHSLALTDAGWDLLTEARQLVSSWDQLEEKYLSANDDVRGKLKVVAPVALGQTFLAKVACRFQMKHPNINISWELQDEPIRFSELGCDCWIKIGPITDDSLIVRTIGKVERMLVVAPALLAKTHCEHPQELEDVPLVALNPFEGQKIPLSHEQQDSYELMGHVAMSTNNIFSLKQAALLGMGSAVLPRWFIESELQSGTLVDILPQWRAPTLTINLAYLPSRHQPNRLRLFLDMVTNEITQLPGINSV